MPPDTALKHHALLAALVATQTLCWLPLLSSWWLALAPPAGAKRPPQPKSAPGNVAR